MLPRRVPGLINRNLILAGVRATRTANQSVANNSNTNVTFPTEDFDTHGFHSTVSQTDRLTVPVGQDGLYLLIAGARFAANTAGDRFYAITINNAELNQGDSVRVAPTSAGFFGVQVLCLFELVAGDYARLRVKQDSGVALNITGAKLEMVRLK